jgi:hypothetical protein
MSGVAACDRLRGQQLRRRHVVPLEAFARALALDLAPIRVNTIEPGC